MFRHKIGIFFLLTLAGFYLLSTNNIVQVHAQPRITNTPIPVIIPTLTATVPHNDSGFVAISPSPTFTATPELPNAKLIAIVSPGDALVRDFPENGEVIGYLEASREYQVIGQYYSWYQIQFAESPNGRAWVYIETIRISGDIAEIPFIEPNAAAASNSFEDNQTQTAIAIFQTPGIADTATAQARILTVPAEELARPTSEFPPTYTPPAEIVLRHPTIDPNSIPSATPQNIAVRTALTSLTARGLPPMIPILTLAILGILGLIIGFSRR
jgi:hypothetical protein